MRLPTLRNIIDILYVGIMNKRVPTLNWDEVTSKILVLVPDDQSKTMLTEAMHEVSQFSR